MLNYKLSEKIIWETRQIIRPKSTNWNARLFSQMQTTNILGKISYYTPIHRNLCENEDEDTSTTNCICIHEIKKKSIFCFKKKENIWNTFWWRNNKSDSEILMGGIWRWQ